MKHFYLILPFLWLTSNTLFAQHFIALADGRQLTGKIEYWKDNKVYFRLTDEQIIAVNRTDLENLTFADYKSSSATTGRITVGKSADVLLNVTDELILTDGFIIKGQLLEITDRQVYFNIRGNNPQYFDRDNIKVINIGTKPQIRPKKVNTNYLTGKQQFRRQRLEDYTLAYVSYAPTAVPLLRGRLAVRNADFHRTSLDFAPTSFLRMSGGLSGTLPYFSVQPNLPIFRLFHVGFVMTAHLPGNTISDNFTVSQTHFSYAPVISVRLGSLLLNGSIQTEHPTYLIHKNELTNNFWVFGETKTIGATIDLNDQFKALFEGFWILDNNADQHRRLFFGLNYSNLRLTIAGGLSIYRDEADFDGQWQFLRIFNGSRYLPGFSITLRIL